jgi:hypothetical protein
MSRQAGSVCSSRGEEARPNGRFNYVYAAVVSADLVALVSLWEAPTSPPPPAEMAAQLLKRAGNGCGDQSVWWVWRAVAAWQVVLRSGLRRMVG